MFSTFVLFFVFIALSYGKVNDNFIVIRLDNSFDVDLADPESILTIEETPYESIIQSDGSDILLSWIQKNSCEENQNVPDLDKHSFYVCSKQSKLFKPIQQKYKNINVLVDGFFKFIKPKYAVYSSEPITYSFNFCDGSDCLSEISKMYDTAGLSSSSQAYLIPFTESCSDAKNFPLANSLNFVSTVGDYFNEPFQHHAVYEATASLNISKVIRSFIEQKYSLMKACGCASTQCKDLSLFSIDLGFIILPTEVIRYSEGAQVLQHEPSQPQPDDESLLADRELQQTNNTSSAQLSLPPTTGCIRNSDCLNGQGLCQNNICRGFEPDVNGDRVFQCPQNYRCDFLPGNIPGVNIDSSFYVMAIPPGSICGASPAVSSSESVFMGENKWQCSDGNLDSCVFSAGIAKLVDNSELREGVRLCGCPNVDSNENRIVCDLDRDYYVNLGLIVVQECFMNAHCAHKQFAQCSDGKCLNAEGLLAGTSLKMFKCVTSQNCSVRAVTQKAIAEALKVVQVSDGSECGSDIGLSPEALTDAMLPCVLDVDDDGICEINLGIPEKIGRSRLCACSGDRGNNGVICDQPEDFDSLLGYFVVQECIVDSDCPTNSVCISTKCISDNKAPNVVSSYPINDASVVPPLNKISVTWNENVTFSNSGNKIVLSCNTCPKQWKAELAVYDPSNYKISQTGYSVTLEGRDMQIIPSTIISSIPEGAYTLSIPSNIVTDLAGNPNTESTPIKFSVSRTADCPFLYLTGFSVADSIINGLYSSIDTINKHPAWLGGANSNYYIYWREPEKKNPGTWVISTHKRANYVRAYLDVEKAKDVDISYRPISGAWKKWNDIAWETYNDIIVNCVSKIDNLSPQLTLIIPTPNTFGFPVKDGLIELYFDEPVQYGQWEPLKLVSRNKTNPHVVEVYSDYEKNMRNKYLFVNGTNQVKIRIPEELQPGTTYDITFGPGFLTDLAYNPWGAVKPGILYFTTYGRDCPPIDSYYKVDWLQRFIILDASTKHGGSATFSCRKPYTMHPLPGKIADIIDGSLTLDCIDGDWTDLFADCMAPCPRMSSLVPSNIYAVENEMSENPHGTQITVNCQPDTVVIHGTGSAVSTCVNGNWVSESEMSCAFSCGKFPALGPAYEIEYDVDSLSAVSTILGSKRIIRCAKGARLGSGTSPTVVVCEERGWSIINISCHISCGPPPSYDDSYVVRGLYGDHGSSYELACAKDYKGVTTDGQDAQYAIVRCNEGKWEQNTSFVCRKNCGKFSTELAYKVEPISGRYGDHNSEIRVSCAPHAVRAIDSVESEVIKCDNGSWSTSVKCYAACEAPVVVRKYNAYDYYIPKIFKNMQQTMSVVDGRQIYQHFTHGYLMCSTDSTIESGSTPDAITCFNGKWVSSFDLSLLPVEQFDPSIEYNLVNPKLKCSSPCTNFNKEITAYTSITPLVKGFIATDNDDTSESNWMVPAGTIGTMSCRNGYSSTNGNVLGRFVCKEGKWEDEDLISPFECIKDCDENELFNAEFFHNYEFLNLNTKIMKHNETQTVACRSPYFLRPETLSLANVTCLYGKLRLPQNFACFPPTCNDGIINGLEAGVDCGAPNCRPCSDCDLGLTTCTPSCSDGVKNGDEEGIDCGGSCLACSVCRGFPPEMEYGILYKLDEGAWLDVTAVNATTVVAPQNTKLYLSCMPEFHSYNKEMIKIYNCDSSGDWSLVSTGLAPFKCIVNSCNDFIINGDETGLDCGGSCPNKCNTCDDGIQNGGETGVDCGGPLCLPCTSCRTTFLKDFTSDVQVEKVDDGSILDVTTLTEILHGTQLSVKCINDKNKKTSILECLDGRINALPGTNTNLYNLPCHYAFDTNQNTKIEALYAIQLNQQDCPNNSSYCEFSKRFNALMSSECGALLYGNKQSQVMGFCDGKCYKQLYNLLYEKFTEEHVMQDPLLAEILPSIQQLLNQFCHIENREYCFASIQDTLDKMNNLQYLPEAQLSSICVANSCFKQNLKYFRILDDLFNKKQYSSSLKPFFYGVPEDALLTEFNSSMSRSEGSYEPPVRPFNKTNYFLRSQLQSPKVRKWLTASRYSEDLVNLICLRDFDGKLCAPVATELIKLIESKPTPSDQFDSVPFLFDRQNLCGESCYSLTVRYFGQTLLNDATKGGIVDPYQALLGVLIRSYGRLGCQFTTFGKPCADIFGSTVKSLSPPFLPPIGNKSEQYKDCNANKANPRCPISFIGDNHCDPECFRPECGFDENDCMFEKMFPLTYQRLTSQTPLADECHPFHVMFDCSSTPNSLCKSKLTDVILEDGCCAASRWDLLRELMRYNVELRSIAESKDSLTSIVPSTTLYPLLNLDRSPFWIETSCRVALDRTCANGIKRSLVQAQYKLLNINYNDIFHENFRELSYNVLSKSIRETMSNLLAISRYDITEIRFWPGSISIEVVFDLGLQSNEVLGTLRQMRENRVMMNALKETIKKSIIYINNIRDQYKSPVVGRSLQEISDATFDSSVEEIDFQWVN